MSDLTFSVKGLEEQQRRLRDERRNRVGVTVAVIASLFVLAGRPPPTVVVTPPPIAGPAAGVAAAPAPGVGPQGPPPLVDTPPPQQVVASLLASPARLDFGVQPIGAPSQARSVTLINTGTKTFAADYDDAAAAGSFAVTGCRQHIYKTAANNSACTLRIAFRPASAGMQNARIAVFEIDEAGAHIGSALATIDVTGEGAPASVPTEPAAPAPAPPARIDAVPTELDFSSPRPGRQDVIVRNPGTAPVSITDTRVTGREANAFRLDDDDCTAQPLAAGGQCTLSVIRRFFAAASLEAELQIEHTGADSPTRVRLTRTPAPAATVQAAPESLDFGQVRLGRTSSQRITFSNVGTVEARTLATGFIGNSDSYRLGQNGCGAALAPQAQCTVEVVFAPVKAGSLRSGLMIAGTIVVITGTGEQGD